MIFRRNIHIGICNAAEEIIWNGQSSGVWGRVRNRTRSWRHQNSLLYKLEHLRGCWSCASPFFVSRSWSRSEKKHFLWRWHRLHLASPQHFDTVMTHLVVDKGTDNGKPHSICLVAKNFKIKVWEHFRVIPVWELKKKLRDTLTRATLSLTENGKLANQIERLIATVERVPFLESKKRCELLCWLVFKWLSKIIGRTNFFWYWSSTVIWKLL